MMTPLEINPISHESLIKALGFDGMVRFLRQFESGSGDYTKERDQLLESFTLENIVDKTEKARKKYNA